MRLGGLGFNLKITRLTGSVGELWSWDLTRFGDPVAKGVERTEKDAHTAAARAFGDESLDNAEKARPKQAVRQKLKYLVKTRPYLVAAVCELAWAMNADLMRVMEEAEERELHWQQQEPPRFRKEIPHHHRSLTPADAARQVFEAFVTLGWVKIDEHGNVSGNGVKAYALKTFGAEAFGWEESGVEPNEEEKESKELEYMQKYGGLKAPASAKKAKPAARA